MSYKRKTLFGLCLIEALGQVLEARVNSYFAGITEPRVIKDVESTRTIERVVDGADIEFNAGASEIFPAAPTVTVTAIKI